MSTANTPTESPTQDIKDVKLGLGLRFELLFERWFTRWGIFVANNPYSVMTVSLVLSLGLAFGLTMIKVTIDPVDLWVASGSQARSDMDYFSNNFMKFYRIEQIIAAPKNKLNFRGNITNKLGKIEEVEFGPAFRHEFMRELFMLQQRIENITIYSRKTNRPIKLTNLCYKPLSQSDTCATQSVFTYFQNDIKNLNEKTYLQKVYECPT